MRVFGRRLSLFLLIAVLLSATITIITPKQTYAADQIIDRSLTLQPGPSDGGSEPSGVVDHAFAFELPQVGAPNVGSILFQYCTTASGTCNLPTGLVTTNATLGAQTGATGFSIDTADVNGSPYITRSAASIAADTPVTYRLDDITNPSTANETFYVRISTYTSVDTTGTAIDSGVVAASTATQIVLSGLMPEFLAFCAGETVTVNCGSVVGGGNITFDSEFSPSFTRFADSQFAASTNADSGYTITVRGPTMTSGSNTITAIGGTATAATTGTLQFGMNLRDNTTPNVGANINPASGGATLQAQPTANFDTADQYAFTAGANNVIANSDDDGTSGPTDSQVYTASYIVNVTGSLPVGTYTTTLTYVCTSTF